jgi:RNA-directed DNA polymerase
MHIMTETTTTTEEWNLLPLTRFEVQVFRLQRRVFNAAKNNNHKQVHKMQQLLVSSFSAKCLAVHQVAEINRGRDSAGVDHVRSLNPGQKLELANNLSLDGPWLPARRVWIPKPGKPEKRPLGIPAMRDRARQALILLALEPEWEAKFSKGMFGFRKGRGAHDAIKRIRTAIERSPKWVLDADIERFFDNVNHEALLRRLETFPKMRNAIRQLLKSGVMEGPVWSKTENGTPQGGPLSPLLANIALSHLEPQLTTVSQQWLKSDEKRNKTAPVLVLYADDFVVLHEDRRIVEQCRDWIASSLNAFGLRLHPEKTTIRHTLEKQGMHAGFDFLGFHIQQHRVGKYALKPWFKQVATIITPSAEAQRRVYGKLAGIVDKLSGLRKEKRAEELLIYSLNPKIRGWANYFRVSNAKATFSKLDSQLWYKIWGRWRRRYHREGRRWTVKNFFRDSSGKWNFNCQRDSEQLRLLKFADTKIQRTFPLKTEKSFYDGDWAYWAARLGAYPGLPKQLASRLKRQSGRCHICGRKFTESDRHIREISDTTGDRPRFRIVHAHCDLESLLRSENVEQTVASSPVR